MLPKIKMNLIAGDKMNFKFIPKDEFSRIKNSVENFEIRLGLLSDMCRLNALVTVKRAGSGHLGSSFSSLDIVTYLYCHKVDSSLIHPKNPDRDIYFSSKGHDVPGQYAVLYSLGILDEIKFLNLRRIEGTCGHPDVSIEGMEVNSGSLGMGISKAKGIAFSKKLLGRGGRVYVMTGDGELQEGQNYEAFQNAPHQSINNITVIVDHNKVQSDKLVENIVNLGDLKEKLSCFGWHVLSCDGHDFWDIDNTFKLADKITDKPKIIIANTIKGKGISFMEHIECFKNPGEVYKWHAGAPDDASFTKGFSQIFSRINDRLDNLGLEPIFLKDVDDAEKPISQVTNEYVANAFGESLIKIASERNDLVVLDADLAADCRIRSFELKYPDRFIENGIAEQDMVSMAGGLALQGLLPVVNSFGAFLASRANEQIYNNACERTKIIYVCHYAGLIPAGPGQSHQSLRDIALLNTVSNIEILEPCNANETDMILDYCVKSAPGNCAIRLVIGPSPKHIVLPDGYSLKRGCGAVIRDGKDAVIFGYGPVMLSEAITASEILERDDNIGLKVVNMPWLNKIDINWIRGIIDGISAVYVIEDHFHAGGLGDAILNFFAGERLSGVKFKKFAIYDFPAWGHPVEVLKCHGCDGESISKAIKDDIIKIM